MKMPDLHQNFWSKRENIPQDQPDGLSITILKCVLEEIDDCETNECGADAHCVDQDLFAVGTIEDICNCDPGFVRNPNIPEWTCVVNPCPDGYSIYINEKGATDGSNP